MGWKYAGLNRTLHASHPTQAAGSGARFEDEPDFYIDDEGELLPLSPYYTARVPVIHAPSFEAASEAFALVQATANDPLWSAFIDQIEVNGVCALDVVPRIGAARIAFGDAQQLEDKLNKLLVSTPNTSNGQPERLAKHRFDLRGHSRPTVLLSNLYVHGFCINNQENRRYSDIGNNIACFVKAAMNTAKSKSSVTGRANPSGPAGSLRTLKPWIPSARPLRPSARPGRSLKTERHRRPAHQEPADARPTHPRQP